MRIPIIALSAALGAAYAPAHAAEQSKPAAQYWMSVATENMSMPGMEAAMGMPAIPIPGMSIPGMGGPRRSLLLQLVGPETPPDPKADHRIPAGLNMGEALPLKTPEKPKPSRIAAEPGEEGSYEKPKGRMLIYWGCGDTIRAGQPKVIDFAKLSPQDAGRAFAGRNPPRQSPPAPRKGWTYGDWPWQEERAVEVPKDGSLVGEHLVKGNYNVDIPFKLDSGHDFLDPVVFEQVRGGLADAIALQWRAIPNATGYFMLATGNSERGDMVIWTPSESQEMGFSLLDYLPNATVQQYIKDKVILPPSTTGCTIPKGVFKDMDAGNLQFIAYGNELNLAQPPKPKDPKEKWNPIWTAKVRIKSTGMLMLGMEDDGGRRGATAGAAPGGGRDYTAQKRAKAAVPPPAGGEAKTTEEPKDPAGNAAQEVIEGAKKLKGLFGF